MLDDIKYDTPTEVTEKQFKIIMTDLSGTCAGKKIDGKFFIKLWVMKYKQDILNIINTKK